jgi:hypothetical protein
MDEAAAANMNSEMATLMAELKRQKEEMEIKLKAVEDEKSKLKSEMESNQREADKKLVTAELDIVRKEKEEMALLIKKLEKAKKHVEEKLEDARLETRSLKEDLMETASVVQEMEEEKQQLQLKLSTAETSRDDIHMRLMEVEGRLKQLKDEKRMKSMEIRELRQAGEVYAPLVEQSQRQKRSISKELKRAEEEQFQLRSMMSTLDNGNLKSLSISEHLPENHGRTLFSARRSNSSNNLMDQANEYLPQLPRHPRSSSMNMLTNENFTNTNNMMSNLEREIMMAQVRQVPAEEVSVISSCVVDRIDMGNRPAGWLGDTIANRSFTNLHDLDEEEDEGGGRRHRSRSSSRSLRSRSSSKSRRRSRSGDRKRSDKSSISEKKEKLRQSEKKFRDGVRRSRSSRSMDCDGSYHSLQLP